jgi:curved DNA-binding protein CbpA
MSYLHDKRLFKRYKHKADFSLIIEGTSHKASTVDFSLSGLCIFIEGTPAVGLNSTITLNIEGMDLDIEANVVWVQKTDSNLLVGLKKMSISGLLKYYPLSDILLDLQRSDATGTLEIRSDPACKQIFLKNGIMVFAASNSEEDRIEEILLRNGKITNDQYYQLANIAGKTRKLQGKTLVEMGFLEPRDLFISVKHQCEEIVLSLFPWEDGRVAFIEGPLPSEIPTFKLNAANLIFHGIKRINKPEYFQSVSPPLDTIVYYSEEPINLFQDIHFSENDQYVFSLVDSKITVGEMFSISSLGEFPTMKIISALLSTRMIVPIGKGFIPDKNIVKIIREPRKGIDSAFIERVQDIFKRLESMDYYTILGIDRRASQNEVKKAFYKCAKEFHPDRHFGVSSEAIKVKLNAIFAFINDAHRILSDPAERAGYDGNLSGSASKPEIDKVETARVRFQEGKASLRKGLYEDAAMLFGQAVYFDGSAAEYHFCLGTTYAKLHKLRDAEKAINDALEIDPRNAEYVAELGQIYLLLGFRSRAKSTFEKAIKLDPSNRKANECLKSV